MFNRKQNEEQKETLFEQQFRQQLKVRQAKDDVLFFGLIVMGAICMSHGLISIPM